MEVGCLGRWDIYNRNIQLKDARTLHTAEGMKNLCCVIEININYTSILTRDNLNYMYRTTS